MPAEVQEVAIRLRADGVLETTTGIEITSKMLARLTATAQAAADSLDKTGVSAGQTRAAMRQLPAQITDIWTSLASGQQPLTVFIQQGGQIKDSFGGVVPAARALLSTLTPLNVAIGAGALAGGGLATAFYQGWQQSRELQNALALTGNQVGITEGQFNGLVVSLASARSEGAGAVRDMYQAIVAGGQTSGAALEATGRAGLALAKLNGQSAVDSLKAFNGMSDGVAAWAAKANRSYAYLSVEQYKAIRSLEEQGRTGEAMRMNMEALAGTLESRTAPSLGLIEQSLKTATTWWNNFWDGAKGIGRADTAEEQIAKLQVRIAKMGAADHIVFPWSNGTTSYQQANRELETLQREAARTAIRTADQAAERADAQQAILRLSRSYQDAQLGVQAATDALSNANTQRSLEERRTLIERAYRQFAVSGERYRDEMIAIERSRLAAEEQMAARAVEIEKGRVIDTEGGAAQVEMRRAARDAAVAQAQARLQQLRQQASRLQADIDAGRFDPKPREVADTPRQAFRRTELESDGYGRARDAMQGQLNESKNAAYELMATNRSINADLIRDDQLRAQAQLQLEAKSLQDRLMLQAGSDDERRFKQQQFDEWMVLRQRQVTEQLKPEWQRMLEAWQDTNLMMRQSYDSMWTSMLRSGEDAFVQLVTKGSFNAKALADIWLQEMARIQFRKFMGSSGPGGSFFGSLMGVLSGNPLVGASGFGDYNSSALLAAVRHSGGTATESGRGERWMPAAVFTSAPRFHTGIGPDELPAVIKRDEGVFTAGQMRAMAPVSALAKASGPRINFSPVYNIDSRTDRAEVLAQMTLLTRQSQAELLDMMERRQA